ncbi:MAG TPA: GspE/PulE family protein [bacterium]
MTTTTQRLGRQLVEQRLISEEQLADALKLQTSDQQFLGAILLERGWVKPEALLEAAGAVYGLPTVRLREMRIEREALAQVPLKVALHFKVMPLSLADGTLRVAIANPQDLRLLDDLGLALERRVKIEPVLATEAEILDALKRHYGLGADTVDRIVADRARQPGASPAVPEESLEDIEHLAGDASVIKLVNQLILEAHQRRATDIHLEPYRGTVRLRYRVDGLLEQVDVPPAIRELFPAIISRVKVLSNLNIVERRLPQDGRASVKIGKEKLDLRIATLPTPAGESVVIRILPNQMLLDFAELGFQEQDLALLERMIRKPHGLICVTGPTGSGKTTTLYACLKRINTEERKIITIEDPVEYEMAHVTQVQVHPEIGLSFAQGLRSMLRHDPDVMMVGEVRDLETAELAVRCALTGHLVFSTLHTNDAVSALVRLMDMGVDPYLIASSIECIIAQRLVRTLCAHCKADGRPRGCEECHRMGYLGRTAIYEFFVMSEPIRELILERASLDVVRRRAAELGMRPMRQHGEEKVRTGLTTMEELLRVIQDDGS